MKIIYTLLLSLLFLSSSAQKSDSTRVRKSTNSYGSVEKCVELKSKPNIKNGSAQVFLHNKLIATGLYKDNKRVGRWRFFNGDSIAQLYNYNSRKIEYNVPDTSLAYNIDSLNQGDKLLYPAKIGSMNDLYWYLASTARIPDELKQINDEYQLIFTLDINKLGKITKPVIDYRLDNLSKSYELVDQTYRYKDFDFVPAIVNDKAVNSQMMLKGRARIGY